MGSDPESVWQSVAQMMCCTLPAGGFQSGRESATEGTSLIIFSVRHYSSVCPRFVTVLWGQRSSKIMGVLLNVYSAGRPCPCSWRWPTWWSRWHDPGVWTDSRCPPAVFAKPSRDPLLHSERAGRSQHLQYLWSLRVFTRGLRAKQTSLPANKAAACDENSLIFDFSQMTGCLIETGFCTSSWFNSIWPFLFISAIKLQMEFFISVSTDVRFSSAWRSLDT